MLFARRVILTFFLALLTAIPVLAGSLFGTITDAETGHPLAGATVMVIGSPFTGVTDSAGVYSVSALSPGSYRIIARSLGHQPVERVITITDKPVEWSLRLSVAPLELDVVVYSATRIPTPAAYLPANVSVVTAEDMRVQSALTVDQLIANEAGVSAIRDGGIYAMTPSVTLRGTGSLEPGRTLVLIDGMPINKGDTGEANWNRLKLVDFERVEIVRGPLSSVYGAGAMGGVIDLRTPAPVPGLKLHAKAGGGSYGTAEGEASTGYGWTLASGDLVHLRLSATSLTSDGYNGTPEQDRDEYTVNRFLRENSQTAELAWLHNAQQVKLLYQRYDDLRGEGIRIEAPDGVSRSFTTNFGGLTWNGRSGSWFWEASSHWQKEKYTRVDERLKGDSYQRFDVLSDRVDAGVRGSLGTDMPHYGTLLFIVEGSQGQVKGADVYRTSPDRVANQGTLETVAAAFEHRLAIYSLNLRLTTQLRFDQARFQDGEINSTLSPWDAYNGALAEHDWSTVSPSFGINWQALQSTSLYASLGQAFRAPILDDLTRSGFTRVGPKIANPELGPEKMIGLEGGVRQIVGRTLIRVTGYYGWGRDIQEYVSTGETIFNGRFTLQQRQNLARVHFMGVEYSLHAPLMKTLDVRLSAAVTHTEIIDFPERPDLVGSKLEMNPEEVGRMVVTWMGPVTSSVTWELTGAQYYYNGNEKVKIPGYGIVHARVSRDLMKSLRLDFDIRNILDRKYLQSVTTLDPGRFMMLSLNWNYGVRGFGR